MRVRVRHPNGNITLDNLLPSQTVGELRKQIEATLNITRPNTVQVAGGYPPRTFAIDDATLEASGIHNGETLHVTIVPLSESANAPPAETPREQPSLVSHLSSDEPSLTQTAPVRAPAGTSTGTPVAAKTQNGYAVSVNGGSLVVRTMEDDNSCLFRSIGKIYVMQRDPSMAQDLRNVVATVIAGDAELYNDVTLGEKREKYIEWIQKSTSWGGSIELSIFSKFYSIEIDSIDVQTGRIDRYGEGSFDERVLVLYNGIHYDAIALSPMEDCPEEFDQTRFPTQTGDNDDILIAAQALAEILRKNHQYTDVANFTLRCNQCLKGLVGEKDATAHAKETGHVHFVEYT